MAATLLQTSTLTKTENAGTAQTFTFASGVPSGSGVVLNFVHYPGGNPTGITDNLGNTYTLAVRADAGGNQAEIWHALNITSNGTTPLVITATFSAAGNYTTGVATAWSGIQGLDRTASATETSGPSTAHTVAAALPNTQADILAFTCVVVNDSVNDAGLGFSTAGWNLLWRENNSNGFEAGQAGYRSISAVETTSVTHSTTIGTLLHKVLATYRVVGSGGGGASGTLAATESGNGTFAGAGSSLSQGSMTTSESATKDAFASSGSLLASGSMAVTEAGADAAVFSGSTGASPSSGVLAATEAGADAAAFSVVALVAASLAASEVGSDTFSASSMTTSSGSLAAAEVGSDLASASGTALSQGSLAATEAGFDTPLIFGETRAQGVVSTVESGPDTASFVGGIVGGGILIATETGSDALAASGSATAQGALNVTEIGSDLATASAVALAQGLLAATEIGADVFVATGVRTSQGSLAATEFGSDVAVFLAVPISVGFLAAVEVGSDVFAATGQLGPVLELISDPDYTAVADAESYTAYATVGDYVAVAEAFSYTATAQ